MTLWPCYVYILSDYEESGADNVTATLDRSKLMDMVKVNWPFEEQSGPYSGSPEAQKKWHEEWIAEGLDGLATLLAAPDENLADRSGGWQCHGGWGGMMLHVVKLV